MSSESSHHDEESQGENPTERQVEYWTAKDITKHSFPAYTAHHSHHATGTSLGNIYFNGESQSWSNFASEVCATFNGIEWDEFPEIIDATIEDNRSITLSKEYYKCGAEISTSGRYVQHVLHPMSAVFQELGLLYAFGDFGASNEARKTDKKKEEERADTRKVPDYTLLDLKDNSPVVIGEAEHPWNTNPEGYVDSDSQGFRRYFGQVARDMWLYRKKYAFMTNYLFTVFLRQDLVNGRVKLFYSSAIPNDGELDTASKEVSVRACMLHLAKRASEDPTFDSQKHITLENWAGDDFFKNQRNTTAGNVIETKAKERGIQADKRTGSAGNTSMPKKVIQTSSESKTDHTRKTRSQSKPRERGIHTDQPTGSASNTSQPRQVIQAATPSEANTDNARKTRNQSKSKDSDREAGSIKGKQPIRPKPRGA